MIYHPPSYLWPAPWGEVFGNGHPVEVDIGCGDGGFLCQAAQAFPARNFLGIERLLGRVRKIERRCRRLGIGNVRVLRLESSYSVAYLLPPGSVEVFHLYCPDPFPKKKHAKRRLVNAPFVESVVRALVPGGRFWVRTDHAGYFETICAEAGAHGGLERWTGENPYRELQTDFERQFRAEGKPIHCAGYVRKEEAGKKDLPIKTGFG
ncbi:MAG: tRNA (guanosine(46)-N7)-methyltransferase TrmB [Verrucomicrobiae bacterium]|nr:tRNA (guanosine(46)-N7)-methyltransferase TrmB [Verrucomicrobiae bacterium]